MYHVLFSWLLVLALYDVKIFFVTVYVMYMYNDTNNDNDKKCVHLTHPNQPKLTEWNAETKNKCNQRGYNVWGNCRVCLLALVAGGSVL